MLLAIGQNGLKFLNFYFKKQCIFSKKICKAILKFIFILLDVLKINLNLISVLWNLGWYENSQKKYISWYEKSFFIQL